MTARTVLSTFYGIDMKTHNDPYIPLIDGPPEELSRNLTGIAGLVVRLSHCLYFHLYISLPVRSLLPAVTNLSTC
jgi:hypothetical protein